MIEAFLVGSGLAVVLMLGVVACWRAYPPALRRPVSSVSLVVLLALLLTLATATFGACMASAAAGLALVLVSIVFISRGKRAWRVQHALDAFAEGADIPRAMRELRASLGPEPSRSRSYVAWSLTLIHCAGHLSRQGLHREALETVGLLDITRLDPLGACARGQAVAATSLALGDRARARAELSRLSRPAPTRIYERALSALGTLLDVLEGQGAVLAPTLEARIAEETEPSIRATLRGAHAHALAADGRRDEAMAVLRELWEGAPGARALERVVMHAGPASSLALSLLAEDMPPYR